MIDEATLEADDSRARAEALDVTRSFVVQAPAGSGKTELLIQRYLSLLACVERPENVLAITFTKKAADEMLARVMAALERAAAGDESSLAHEETTLVAARSVLARSEARRWDIEFSPRRLRIQTLDAFCAGVARSLPLTSGMGGQPAIVQDAPAYAIYQRASLATLDWLVDDAPIGRAVERVLSHLDNDSSAYVDSIADMLSKRDQWLAIVGGGVVEDPNALRKKLEDGIERVIQQQLAELRTRLGTAFGPEVAPLAAYAGRNVLASGRSESPIAALRSLDRLPGSSIDDLPAWYGLAELLLTKGGKWRRTVNESHGFPRKDKAQKAAWLELLKTLPG